MKAFVLRGYGSCDMLDLTEIPTPTPTGDEVLVRVRATSINPYDWHNMRGEPIVARLMGLGLRRPLLSILGADLAGQVEAVGPDVREFRPGDDVFAVVKEGGFGEYALVKEGELAAKPANLTYEQAAAVPLAANSALIGLRDKGRLRSGQKVLINGASGGVGTFAVQIARAFGAEVTGVCRGRGADLVRSLGAAAVIDRTSADFTRGDARYDLLLDNAGGHSAFACRRVLTREGAHVIVGGQGGRWVRPVGHMFGALLTAPLASQRTAMVDAVACETNKANLLTLTELIEAGKLTPVIDRTYGFDQIPEAVAYQEQGHTVGKVVITTG